MAEIVTSCFLLTTEIYPDRERDFTRHRVGAGVPLGKLIELLMLMEDGDSVCVRGMKSDSILATVGHAASFMNCDFRGHVYPDGTVRIERHNNGNA